MSRNNAGDQATRVNPGDSTGHAGVSLEHRSGYRFRPETRWTLDRPPTAGLGQARKCESRVSLRSWNSSRGIPPGRARERGVRHSRARISMGFCADREGEHVEEAGDGRRVGRLAVGHRQNLPAGTGQHCGLDAGMTGSTKRETGQRGNAEPGGHQCLHRDEIVGGERYLRREPGRFALPEQVAAAALAAGDPAAVREVGQVRLSGEGVLAGWRRPPWVPSRGARIGGVWARGARIGRVRGCGARIRGCGAAERGSGGCGPAERGSERCGPAERGSAVCGSAERGSEDRGPGARASALELAQAWVTRYTGSSSSSWPRALLASLRGGAGVRVLLVCRKTSATST